MTPTTRKNGSMFDELAPVRASMTVESQSRKAVHGSGAGMAAMVADAPRARLSGARPRMAEAAGRRSRQGRRPRCGARLGFPRFRVAPRPGCQGRGSSSERSRRRPAPSAGTRRWPMLACGPVSGPAAGPRPLNRSTSHATRFDVAPACRIRSRSCPSSVTTSVRARSAYGRVSTSETMRSSAERKPPWWTLIPGATGRLSPSPRSACPSSATMIEMSGGRQPAGAAGARRRRRRHGCRARHAAGCRRR